MPVKPRFRGRLHQVTFWLSLPAGAWVIVASTNASSYVAASLYAASVVALFGTEAPSARPADPALGVTAGLRAILRIATSFASGEMPRTSAAIAEDLALPEPAVGAALALLVRAGILALAEHEGEPCFVLARDPATIRVKDVLDALRRSGAGVDLAPRTGSDLVADRILSGLEAEFVGSAHNRTLRELAHLSLETPDPSSTPIGIEAGRPDSVGGSTTNASHSRAS